MQPDLLQISRDKKSTSFDDQLRLLNAIKEATNLELIKVLVEKKLVALSPISWFPSPLLIAVKTLNQPVVEFLIKAGADANLAQVENHVEFQAKGSFAAAIYTPIDYLSEYFKFCENSKSKQKALKLLEILLGNRPCISFAFLEQWLVFMRTCVKLDPQNRQGILDYAVTHLVTKNIAELTTDWQKHYKALKNQRAVNTQSDAGAQHEETLSIRIAALFTKLASNQIKENSFIELFKKELLVDIEALRLLADIKAVPDDLSFVEGYEYKSDNTSNFKELRGSIKLAISTGASDACYAAIAENIIQKISHLEDGEEYIIPTGWTKPGHAICICLTRISQCIVIRVDNSDPPDMFCDFFTSEIKPKVLGSVSLNSLDDGRLHEYLTNIVYLTKLLYSSQMKVSREDGERLIYNIESYEEENIDHYKVTHLIKFDKMDVEFPGFQKQSASNCYIKCYEPGMRYRFRATQNERAYSFAISIEQLYTTERLKHHRLDYFYWPRLYLRIHHQQKAKLEFWLGNRKHITDRFYVPPQLKVLKGSLCGKSSKGKLPKSKQQFSFMDSEIEAIESDKFLMYRYMIDAMLINPEDGCPSNYIVLGDTASGKSSLINYLCSSATDTRINSKENSSKLEKSNYNWVLHLSLGELALYSGYSDKAKIRASFISHAFGLPQLPDSFYAKIRKEESEGELIWLLDNYESLNSKQQLITDVINDMLLDKKINTIVTSRFNNLPARIAMVSNNFQIMPFDKKHIHEYIKRYFATFDKDGVGFARQLIDYLESYPNIFSLCKSPLLLHIICVIWHEKTIDGTLTSTQLYEKVVYGAIKKTKLLININRKDILKALALLAYKLFECDTERAIDVSHTKVKEILRNAFPKKTIDELLSTILDTGLFLKVHTPTFNKEVRYKFLHTSIQEYLVANYIATMFMARKKSISYQDAINLANTYKHDPFFVTIWGFVAGILSRDDIRRYDKFYDLLFRQPPFDLGIHNKLLEIRCLEQFHQEFEDDLLEVPENLISWLLKYLPAGDNMTSAKLEVIQIVNSCPRVYASLLRVIKNYSFESCDLKKCSLKSFSDEEKPLLSLSQEKITGAITPFVDIKDESAKETYMHGLIPQDATRALSIPEADQKILAVVFKKMYEEVGKELFHTNFSHLTIHQNHQHQKINYCATIPFELLRQHSAIPPSISSNMLSIFGREVTKKMALVLLARLSYDSHSDRLSGRSLILVCETGSNVSQTSEEALPGLSLIDDEGMPTNFGVEYLKQINAWSALTFQINNFLERKAGNRLGSLSSAKHSRVLLNVVENKYETIPFEDGSLIKHLSYRPDGGKLATGGNESKIRLWKVCSSSLQSTKLLSHKKGNKEKRQLLSYNKDNLLNGAKQRKLLSHAEPEVLIDSYIAGKNPAYLKAFLQWLNGKTPSIYFTDKYFCYYDTQWKLQQVPRKLLSKYDIDTICNFFAVRSATQATKITIGHEKKTFESFADKGHGELKGHHNLFNQTQLTCQPSLKKNINSPARCYSKH